MQDNMSASATTNLPMSEVTTLAGPPPAQASSAPSPEPGLIPEYTGNELVIQPSKGWIGIDWSELLRFRELLFFLVWRDVKVRYKQAILGVGWAVLEPVLNMLVLTAIFGGAAKMDQYLPAGLPYPIFVFAGLLCWKLFATALTQGGMSLVNQQNLLTKVYFPRLFVPTATVGSALVDLGLQFLVLLGLFAWYGYAPSWQIVFLPLLVCATVVMALGTAYLLSALTVTYRDFRFLIPVAAQIWMWLSLVPVPVTPDMAANPKWQALMALNPMYGIVSAFRACVTGEGAALHFKPLYLATSIALASGLFVLGLFYFRKTEKRFADIA
jgi:lipopolysaccharide transport system permease protein